LEDTLHAMKSAALQNILVRYFNIGGLPDDVFRGFKKYPSESKMFYEPRELIDYAPVFISKLIDEFKKYSNKK